MKFMFICLLFIACKNQQPSRNSSAETTDTSVIRDEAAENIKKFYSDYIVENTRSINPDQATINDLMKTYCTSSFQKRLDSLYKIGEIDFDIIVNAQDYDSAWLKTLSIAPTKKPKEYTVSYKDEYTGQYTTIRANMQYENGSWKIDNLIPPGLNDESLSR